MSSQLTKGRGCSLPAQPHAHINEQSRTARNTFFLLVQSLGCFVGSGEAEPHLITYRCYLQPVERNTTLQKGTLGLKSWLVDALLLYGSYEAYLQYILFPHSPRYRRVDTQPARRTPDGASHGASSSCSRQGVFHWFPLGLHRLPQAFHFWLFLTPEKDSAIHLRRSSLSLQSPANSTVMSSSGMMTSFT